MVHVQFVPGMLSLFLDTVNDADINRMTRLRTELSSGEAISPDLVQRFRDRFGDRVALDNTYGMTEASIDSTWHLCGPADQAGSRGVPIGRPIDNVEAYVLDIALQPVPAGVTGQIYIGGVGLARGYLNDPARTADVFVPNPHRQGARLYRTGDHGYCTSDGEIVFIGRVDNQVKIRGARVCGGDGGRLGTRTR